MEFGKNTKTGASLSGVLVLRTLWEILTAFRAQMGLTFPILFDDGAAVQSQYNPGSGPTNSVYPQDWIIGVDGTVVHVNTVYEPEEMKAILETELAKIE